MNKIAGLHHLAICTANMKEQIEFFTDKLGMELVALYWMHGVANTWHGFLRLNDESAIAFMSNPEIQNIEVKLGQTHGGNSGANCARGTMQHLALAVKSHEELMALRDRLRSKGVPVLGPMDHGMCVSMYFAGPENLSLEISYSNEPINAEAWIDPEVVELAGITPEELARFKNPAAFEDAGGSVPQPDPATAPGPHMTNYPPGVYEAIMGLPDAEMWNRVENQPPVKVG
ncbi:MAG: VOC family protein [Pseudomonadales bacterium]|nr:VOC family protein [Pseudomonadales bacterium]